MILAKRKPWRSKTYLDWVKTQPSVISCQPADDAHHIKGHGLGGTTKCSDLFTIPLTRKEHTEFHVMGWEQWEERYGSQLLFALKTIERALLNARLICEMSVEK